MAISSIDGHIETVEANGAPWIIDGVEDPAILYIDIPGDAGCWGRNGGSGKGGESWAHVANQIVAFIAGQAVAQLPLVVPAQWIDFLTSHTVHQIVPVRTGLAHLVRLHCTVLNGGGQNTIARVLV